jgi:hypothetical protein
MKIKSGGGITSNKYVTNKAPKVEPKSKAMSPEATAQLGAATAFKKPPLVAGKGYTPGALGPTGVGKATTSTATSGPGSGRTTYASGSQGSYGPVARGETNRAPDPPATAPGKDILRDYGPERRGR